MFGVLRSLSKFSEGFLKVLFVFFGGRGGYFFFVFFGVGGGFLCFFCFVFLGGEGLRCFLKRFRKMFLPFVLERDVPIDFCLWFLKVSEVLLYRLFLCVCCFSWGLLGVFIFFGFSGCFSGFSRLF